MANIIIGKVAPVFKGAWSTKQTYFKLDVVRYNGSSWVCLIDGTVGVIPSESKTWIMVASKGDIGNVDLTVGKNTYNDF